MTGRIWKMLPAEKAADDLRSGKKGREDFRIRMGDKYVSGIMPSGTPKANTMKVTQDIRPIREITGE